MPRLVTVPALTPVIVRLEEMISSNKNKPGDRFRITVAEDVRVGEAVVIPAGSAGEGEVVHAAKPGAGGKAGELILVARYVSVGDSEIRLRSFALGAARQGPHRRRPGHGHHRRALRHVRHMAAW